MSNLCRVLVGFVAIEHLGFLVLEMFLWQTPAVMARFGTTPEFAAASAALAMNQGLYNGFLSAGLVWALAMKDDQRERSTARFFLGCVIVAGLFGGATAKLSIVFVQALPALLAFAATFSASRPVARA